MSGGPFAAGFPKETNARVVCPRGAAGHSLLASSSAQLAVRIKRDLIQVIPGQKGVRPYGERPSLRVSGHGRFTDFPRPTEVFYSYAHEDEPLLGELLKHLGILKRLGVIRDWHDRKITAGTEWKGQIDQHLDAAGIILLLVSPDFIDSDYCWDIELTRALERHRRGRPRSSRSSCGRSTAGSPPRSGSSRPLPDGRQTSHHLE